MSVYLEEKSPFGSELSVYSVVYTSIYLQRAKQGLKILPHLNYGLRYACFRVQCYGSLGWTTKGRCTTKALESVVTRWIGCSFEVLQ